STHLQRILDELLPASRDAQPLVTWPGVEVRRYRNQLYAQRPLEFHNSKLVIVWNDFEPLRLPPQVGGVLIAKFTQGLGLNVERLRQSLMTIRFRQGGERIRLVDRGYDHRIKKLFQEQDIPPWQRDRIPMLYSDEQLAFVGGIGIAQGFAAKPGKEGVIIKWIF